MQKLSFIKNYKNNEHLRNSFNHLASSIFGIEFETWYQHGYWTEKYQPYSFVNKEKVVANVSVNLLNLVINNEVKKAVQIGTVMTHPDYRNQGLSRKLMDLVLEDYKHVDLIYLFANQSVLDFYPKFGFQQVEEVQFFMDYMHRPSANRAVPRELDGRNTDDLAFIHSLARNRRSLSQDFGTASSEELLMFYCVMVFSQNLYYFDQEQALVIFQVEEDTLHLFDIVCAEKVNLQEIVSRIANSQINKVIFHFQPDGREGLSHEPFHTSNVLFVKNLTNVTLPRQFKHPLTAQA